MYYFVAELCRPFVLLWLVTMLAVVNLFRKRVESPRRLLWVAVPLALLFATSTRAVSHLALGSLEWHYPPRHQRPAEAEAIVVLSSNVRLADEVRREAELGEDTIYRCLHAARLYRQSEPCPVVVSGGKVDPNRSGPSLAELMRAFLVTLGVDANDIITEDRSGTTYENAVHSAHLLRQRGIERVALVTKASHLPRAVRCFEARGLEVDPCGCYYEATSFKWSVFTFLPSPGGAKGFQRAWHEWIGLAWYKLRGRT